VTISLTVTNVVKPKMRTTFIKSPTHAMKQAVYLITLLHVTL